MTDFVEILAGLRDLGRDDGEDSDEGVFAPERLHEAAQVAPCVDRFVEGELDPTRRLTVSRTSFPGSPPSLAEKLGRKLVGASPRVLEGVGDAVRKAVAAGYLFFCIAETGGVEFH